MKQIKLEAFTVIEMIVALILVAIVVSIAFAALSLTNRQLYSFQRRFDTMSDYRLLQNALSQDMQHAERVTRQARTLRCTKDNWQVLYTFEDSVIIRQDTALSTDSFFFKVDAVFLRFEGISQQKEGGLIDEIGLSLKRKEEAFMVHQRKMYDASVLTVSGD